MAVKCMGVSKAYHLLRVNAESKLNAHDMYILEVLRAIESSFLQYLHINCTNKLQG